MFLRYHDDKEVLLRALASYPASRIGRCHQKGGEGEGGEGGIDLCIYSIVRHIGILCTGDIVRYTTKKVYDGEPF